MGHYSKSFPPKPEHFKNWSEADRLKPVKESDERILQRAIKTLREMTKSEYESLRSTIFDLSYTMDQVTENFSRKQRRLI